jgi:hypothetical protein
MRPRLTSHSESGLARESRAVDPDLAPIGFPPCADTLPIGAFFCRPLKGLRDRWGPFRLGELTLLNAGQASVPDHLSLDGWEAKLWRPNWTGSTRSWAAIDQEPLNAKGGKNMETMILILAMALIFVPLPFDFNDLLHAAFALSGFVLLMWWILRIDRNKDRAVAPKPLAPV